MVDRTIAEHTWCAVRRLPDEFCMPRPRVSGHRICRTDEHHIHAGIAEPIRQFRVTLSGPALGATVYRTGAENCDRLTGPAALLEQTLCALLSSRGYSQIEYRFRVDH